MSFRETYRSEVLQSRRDRSRRAFFWGRIVGLMLMVTIGATLRSEPELSRALANAGMDAVMRVTGRSARDPQVAQAAQNGNLPTDRVRVNRFGGTPATPPQDLDPQGIAQDLARQIATQKQ